MKGGGYFTSAPGGREHQGLVFVVCIYSVTSAEHCVDWVMYLQSTQEKNTCRKKSHLESLGQLYWTQYIRTLHHCSQQQ